MDKEELKAKLIKLAKKKKKKSLTLTDIRGEKKLDFYLYEYYDSVVDALEDVGLEPSRLAKRMRIPNEKLYKIIYELGKKIGKRPTYRDLKKAGEGNKIWKRVGGPKKAYERALAKFGSPARKKKSDKKLPEISNKGFFYGAAAEYFVITELLYRGYIAQKMPVDFGLDVYATKGERIFFFQVKNVSFDRSSKRHIPITTSSFARNESARVFYIFVIQRGDTKEALIINFLTMRELKKDKYIHEENEKTMTISFKRVGNSIFVFKKYNEEVKKDMTNYINDWEAIV